MGYVQHRYLLTTVMIVIVARPTKSHPIAGASDTQLTVTPIEKVYLDGPQLCHGQHSDGHR
jgi:hypothetical protein